MAITRRPHKSHGDHIYQYTDTDGGWFVRVEGFTAAGYEVRTHKVDAPRGASYAEAMMLRDRIYADIAAGRYRRDERISIRPWTFGEARERYFEAKTATWRPKSVDTNRSRLVALADLDRYPLPALRQADVAALVRQWKQAGHSSTYINRLVGMVATVLRYARGHGQPCTDITAGITLEERAAERVAVLPDLATIDTFLDEYEHIETCMPAGELRGRGLRFRVQYATGMRPGEAAQLRWSWIDTRTRTVHIPASHEKSRIPKSVPLRGDLLAQIEAYRQRLLAAGTPAQRREAREHGLVFPTRAGAPQDVYGDRVWDRACIAAGLTPGANGWSPHKLRYAATAYWRQLGLSESVIMAWQGHKQPAQHWHYARPFAADLSAAAAMLEEQTTHPRKPERSKTLHKVSDRPGDISGTNGTEQTTTDTPNPKNGGTL